MHVLGIGEMDDVNQQFEIQFDQIWSCYWIRFYKKLAQNIHLDEIII